MPLQPTGLRRAQARAVAALNDHLAGTPGFEALPRTVGRLRRDELPDQETKVPGPARRRGREPSIE